MTALTVTLSMWLYYLSTAFLLAGTKGFSVFPIPSSKLTQALVEKIPSSHPSHRDRHFAQYQNCFKRRAVIALRAGSRSDIDGTGNRGPILLGLTLFTTVWLFSIPPDFRRAHICTLQVCVDNRPACNDCQTLGELRDGIIDYYRNGGGIQFDFSIDPKTIEQNKQLLKEKFGVDGLI